MFDWIKGKKIGPEGLKPPEPWPDPPAETEKGKEEKAIEDRTIEILTEATRQDKMYWYWDSKNEAYYALMTRDPEAIFHIRKVAEDLPPINYQLCYNSDGVVTTIGGPELNDDRAALYEEIWQYCLRLHNQRLRDHLAEIEKKYEVDN